jgi:hypothetical protein
MNSISLLKYYTGIGKNPSYRFSDGGHWVSISRRYGELLIPLYSRLNERTSFP